MDQKTLIGFILIGAILLFWPTYLDFISPEPQENDATSPVESVVQEVEKNIWNNDRIEVEEENINLLFSVADHD